MTPPNLLHAHHSGAPVPDLLWRFTLSIFFLMLLINLVELLAHYGQRQED